LMKYMILLVKLNINVTAFCDILCGGILLQLACNNRVRICDSTGA
jgi:hypothetical protein